jgi:hypothetical protein
MAHFFFRHLVEHLGRGRVFLAQPLGKAAIDAAVLFLVGDGERQNFLLGELGKASATVRSGRCSSAIIALWITN